MFLKEGLTFLLLISAASFTSVPNPESTLIDIINDIISLCEPICEILKGVFPGTSVGSTLTTSVLQTFEQYFCSPGVSEEEKEVCSYLRNAHPSRGPPPSPGAPPSGQPPSSSGSEDSELEEVIEGIGTAALIEGLIEFGVYDDNELAILIALYALDEIASGEEVTPASISTVVAYVLLIEDLLGGGYGENFYTYTLPYLDPILVIYGYPSISEVVPYIYDYFVYPHVYYL